MDPLSATFAALADPTRRAILARLAQGETHVGDLAGPFHISGPAVSRHLRVLEQAGLITREVRARWRVCKLEAPALHEAHDWLAHYSAFWEQALDRLTELVESREPSKTPRPRKPRTVRASTRSTLRRRR